MTKSNGAKPELIPSLLAVVRTLTYVKVSGNPPIAPYRYGWRLQLDRPTTREERAWLRINNWRSSGAKWHLHDEWRTG